jgi:hypothetical protein
VTELEPQEEPKGGKLMAILQSVDGKFYEIADKDLEKYEVPADKVKDILAEMGPPKGGPAGGPGGMRKGGGASPQVVVNVQGSEGPGGGKRGGPPPSGEEGEQGVQPHGYWWANWWSNCWANCWANCWRNCY